jgi:hypothetical protein
MCTSHWPVTQATAAKAWNVTHPIACKTSVNTISGVCTAVVTAAQPAADMPILHAWCTNVKATHHNMIVMHHNCSLCWGPAGTWNCHVCLMISKSSPQPWQILSVVQFVSGEIIGTAVQHFQH